MKRSRTRRVVPTLLAVLCLLGASTFAVACPAVADNGTRDMTMSVSAYVLYEDFNGPYTVGGTLAIVVYAQDDSKKCTIFRNCDSPTGTFDVTFQNGDLSYNQTVATADFRPVGKAASRTVVNIDNPLPAGTYHVDAHFYGDDNFHSTDATLDNVKFLPLTPDVGITQSSTSSHQGDPVTFAASVGSPNGVHPTGTVQLVYGMTNIGAPIPLDSSGNASITRTDLTLSDSSGHTYYFHYSGNYVSSGHGFLNPADSNSIDHQTLTKTPTTTTVVLTTPARRDDPVDIIGGVSAAGGVKPPGTVTFTAFAGGIPFGSTTGTLSGGIAFASFAANTLFPAPYTVIAQYNPSDPGYGASSATTNLVITAPVPLPGVVLAMAATPDPGVLGAPETMHVIATPPAGSSTPVGGTMSFASGATALGTCVLAPAAAGTTACDLITSALPTGVDPITASYPGSTRYAALDVSTSVTINAPAVPIPTATSTSGSPSGSASGTPTSSPSSSASTTPSSSPSGTPSSTSSSPTSATSSSADSSAAPSSTLGAPGSATTSRTGAGGNVGSTTGLSDTGARGLAPLSILAAALLALGAAFAYVGRRRRTAGRHH